jgi:hypothetical protein
LGKFWVLFDADFEVLKMRFKKVLLKNLSSLPKSLETRINTGDLRHERFSKSLPNLS